MHVRYISIIVVPPNLPSRLNPATHASEPYSTHTSYTAFEQPIADTLASSSSSSSNSRLLRLILSRHDKARWRRSGARGGAGVLAPAGFSPEVEEVGEEVQRVVVPLGKLDIYFVQELNTPYPVAAASVYSRFLPGSWKTCPWTRLTHDLYVGAGRTEVDRQDRVQHSPLPGATRRHWAVATALERLSTISKSWHPRPDTGTRRAYDASPMLPRSL